MRTVRCVSFRCPVNTLGIFFGRICIEFQPLLKTVPCHHAGSCRISHGHRIVGRHVCPYFRRLHVAVEPFCPSYQDQRSVGPDPLQYVQCHFHQRVAGNRIQFGTGIEGHKGNCRPRSPVRLHLRVGRVVARRKQYDEQCRVDIRAVHGLDIPHTVCPL